MPIKAQRHPKGHTANCPSVSPRAYTEPFWRIYAQADINGPWLGGFGMHFFKGSRWEIVEFPEMPALPAIENDPRNESGYGSLCFSLHSLYTLSRSILGSLLPTHSPWSNGLCITNNVTEPYTRKEPWRPGSHLLPSVRAPSMTPWAWTPPVTGHSLSRGQRIVVLYFQLRSFLLYVSHWQCYLYSLENSPR